MLVTEYSLAFPSYIVPIETVLSIFCGYTSSHSLSAVFHIIALLSDLKSTATCLSRTSSRSRRESRADDPIAQPCIDPAGARLEPAVIIVLRDLEGLVGGEHDGGARRVARVVVNGRAALQAVTEAVRDDGRDVGAVVIGAAGQRDPRMLVSIVVS